MRALIIGHAYVAKDNRAKWERLAHDGKTEIEIHLPHHWPSWEEDYRPTEQQRVQVQSSEFRIQAGRRRKAGEIATA